MHNFQVGDYVVFEDDTTGHIFIVTYLVVTPTNNYIEIKHVNKNYFEDEGTGVWEQEDFKIVKDFNPDGHKFKMGQKVNYTSFFRQKDCGEVTGINPKYYIYDKNTEEVVWTYAVVNQSGTDEFNEEQLEPYIDAMSIWKKIIL